MSAILERLKFIEPVTIKYGSTEKIEFISIDKLRYSKKRIRQKISRGEITDMAKNLKTFGVLQPLEINERNEVVLGTRRFEAAKLASFEKLPVIRRNTSEIHEIEKQLASDLHSKSLTVIEKAIAFQKLIELKGISKYALAKYLNISHNLVCRTLAILDADARTILLIKQGKISQRMVSMVVYRLKNKNLEQFVVNEIIEKKMSIAQAENFMGEVNDPEVFKKHFLQRVKAFKTMITHFKEKMKVLNFNDAQKEDIIRELNKIDFEHILM
jgi:ParB family chromosome partitioning protein